MRLLHTADWHLGRSLEGRSRRPEQEQMVDEICALADAEDVHLVIIAGDVFDSANPPAFAEELFYDALDRLSADGKRGVLVIAGNHDNPERLCASAPLAVRQNVVLLGKPADVTLLSAARAVRLSTADPVGVNLSSLQAPGALKKKRWWRLCRILPRPDSMKLWSIALKTKRPLAAPIQPGWVWPFVRRRPDFVKIPSIWQSPIFMWRAVWRPNRNGPFRSEELIRWRLLLCRTMLNTLLWDICIALRG